MIIISGPSTIGKNPLIYHMCDQYMFEFVVPSTTRDMRKEEINGKDYNFLSENDFQKKIKNGEISEWDYALNNYYGYTFNFPGDKRKITHGLSRMAIRIKEKYPNDITTIFLIPSNIEKIDKVLSKIYIGQNLELRKSLVREEIKHSKMFDEVFEVENSVFDILNQRRMRLILEKNMVDT